MLIYFECNNKKCKQVQRKFYHNHKDIPFDLKCVSCKKGVADRLLSAPSSKHIITIEDFRSDKPIEVNAETVIDQQEKALTHEDNT